MKTLALFFLTLPLLVGCNTMEGIGKDVKKIGSTIEEKAN